MTRALLLVVLGATWPALAVAETVASIEPIIDNGVIETGPLTRQDLGVRGAFAERLLQCGIVQEVERVLASDRITTTLDGRNTRVQVAAGGFQGRTSPAFVFVVDDRGPRAASHADVAALGDSLGYVMTQDSLLLLDEDRTTSFEFPIDYVALEFRRTPSLEASAQLFETVGEIDPELFATDTSGYTQVGRAYVSLQSNVPAEQFIAGYRAAARAFGVPYTPIIDGVPSLFHGSAGFPGNDWSAQPDGEDYLVRIPARAHEALRRIREFHLRFTRRAVRALARGDGPRAAAERLRDLACD